VEIAKTEGHAEYEKKLRELKNILVRTYGIC
jgi:hypothetical protein